MSGAAGVKAQIEKARSGTEDDWFDLLVLFGRLKILPRSKFYSAG